jgi:DNA modification methylase
VGLACKRTNRGFIGVEIDEKYFNIAKQRIDNDLDYVPEKGPEQMNIFDFI